MSPETAAALPPAKLAEVWSSIPTQLGPCSGLGEASSEDTAGFTVVRVPMKFRTRTLDLTISVAQEKIVGFFVVPHEEPVSAWTLPTYADPRTYQRQEVRVGAEPRALPGTLFLPKGVENAAAVILVHGSGPNDRDETLGPNRPFRDLATGLATRGIAVLSYDKRTKVYPEVFHEPEKSDRERRSVGRCFRGARIPEIQTGDRRRPDHDRRAQSGRHACAADRRDNPSVSKIVILAGATRSLPDLTPNRSNISRV